VAEPDPHQSEKLNPGPHQSEKQDPDPDRHLSKKPDPDPHLRDADPQSCRRSSSWSCGGSLKSRDCSHNADVAAHTTGEPWRVCMFRVQDSDRYNFNEDSYPQETADPDSHRNVKSDA
jgi:hypothetical protein